MDRRSHPAPTIRVTTPKTVPRAHRTAIVLGAALLLLTTAPAGQAQSQESWAPPAPSDTELDWLKLNSGEWLRGEIERIDDDTVYFDSEELDDLEIDFDDVAEIRSPRTGTYRFEGRTIHTGTMAMKDGRIQIATTGGVQTFDRGELVSMLEGEPTELNYWTFLLGVNFTGVAGNAQQLDLGTNVRLKRRTALTRFQTEYIGSYATTQPAPTTGDQSPLRSTTANSHRVPANFDVFLTRHLFLRVPTFEYYSDAIQNLDNRIGVGAGLGYEILSNKFVTWEVTASAIFQYTDFNPLATSPDSKDAGGALGTTIEVDVTSDVDWDTTYKAQLVTGNNSNQNLVSVLSIEIWGPLDLDTTFTWDWLETPTALPYLVYDPTSAGFVPKPGTPQNSDYRISVGLALDF